MPCWSTAFLSKDEFDAFVDCGILVHGSPQLCIAGLGKQQQAAHGWDPAFVAG